ncbi:two-component system response regulator [Candidatus Aerophobetes bacterium]|uniref:Two-component system response regulator n=1 Tax=Aerophobetes bacterium TaxID=2030807 RepID=A0A2A4YDX0_UNCAE|nr:MAG: two-component system response regulator [Candidatus Aerophobetes bacterium]
MEKAFTNINAAHKRVYVGDGEELLDYLLHRGKYKNETDFPRPGIILLDLNMPKVDGREALAKIKSDPKLKSIPVIVLTSSKAEEDIAKAHDLGVNSYIQKPVDNKGLETIFKSLEVYWFNTVRLPEDGSCKKAI